jgi:DNA polymerase-1
MNNVTKRYNVFVKADYSGQELRVLAEVSKDDNMVDAFNKNYDLHLFTANRVFNLGLDDKAFINDTKEHTEACRAFKERRHQAKNGINFPTVYGAFPKRIAADNNVSVEEAQRWLDEFDGLYPGVKRAIQRTRKELREKGYVTTLMGRRRRFPYYNILKSEFDSLKFWTDRKKESGSKISHMERQAFNFKIQGFSADMMKTAAGKIQKILPDYEAKIVLTVHDELVYELPNKYAKDFSSMVKYIMENCVCLSVPIIVSTEIVNNYGD